ncbi:gliding-associated putative ABC transporter substrate-binding component GldG [Filimonas lacunae]|uniref:Gliding-associated putative ABC transporter substrate-binding component GldG n=1 Tax=Filimonas lacunae TaxID=477680 RepID=A0A173MND1_9BACT|nr:gliding motility-associated ABC transporter substrate-binding protein GldG [Filimonas lacunae]BAV08996.1 gliding motility protein GldG [Filimonas lacunae]SIS65476.1 gliding-associated putative ABC transporter substrate-binding component GldG [Filimonas lacunae]
MRNLIRSKYGWVGIAIAFLLVISISSTIHYRVDLTAEKRFSLSASTKKLLHELDTPVTVKVFLTGDLPADYRKLAAASKDLLTEFRDQSGNYVRVTFEQPGEGLDDSARFHLYDSLARLGVVFEQSETVKAADAKSTSQVIMPSALVYYKDRQPYAIDLRSSRKVFKNFNVTTDVPQEDKEATRNAAEALLEFKFADAIDKLTRKYVPSVAYVIGNGEPVDRTVNDLGENLRNDYRLAVFDLKQGYPRAEDIDALIIVKPTQPFSDEDKLKLDQYVMHGGKIIWFVDKLYAEMDSLMRSQADFVAFDRNLNLDDLLFKYGVRINGDLLQDLNCSKIPLVIGYNPDNSPRMQRIPWPYYPFLSAGNENPISKNLDRVLPIFPTSIDTVQAPGIRKTILLASDTNSRVINSPALVSLNSVRTEEDFNSFRKSRIPVAVLLEGRFHSLFANRLLPAKKDSIAAALGQPFAIENATPTKQIVVSDADIVTNANNSTTGPMPMGMLPFENYRFANREFFLNSVDYLVSNSGIFESRNKDVTLRLLDKNKVAEQRTFWQLMNIVVPVLLVLGFGVVLQWRRKKMYTQAASKS